MLLLNLLNNSVTPIYHSNNDSANLVQLSYQQQQHVNFINNIQYGDDVGVAITPENKDNIINKLATFYSKTYLYNISELNVEHEIENFNQAQAYERVNFIDWFILKDSLIIGYRQINSLLKLDAQPQFLNQLTLSLMHIMWQQSYNNQSTILYDLHKCSWAKVNDWQVGSIVSFDNFWLVHSSASLFNDEDKTAWLQQHQCNDDEVYVSFYIVKKHNLSGADIFKIFGDNDLFGQSHLHLFLPNTEFIIDTIAYHPEEKMLYVRISTTEVNHELFKARLFDLVF